MKCNPWVGGSIGRRGFPMLGTGKRGLSTYVKDIFRNGEQGFFYDPNDLSTMFQDAAGTVPVTAAGQPVGLVLDKSKGLVLGEDLVLNGDFTNGGNSWSVAGQDSTHIVTFANGSLRYVSDTTSPGLNVTQTTPKLTVGKWYEVTTYCSNYVSGLLKIDSSTGAVNIVSRLGLNKSIICPLGGNLVFNRNSPNVDVTIDYIQVREIEGNHAYQTTSAARPIVNQTPILGDELAVNAVSSNGATGWVAAFQSTLTKTGNNLRVTATGSTPYAQQIITNLTIGKTYSVTIPAALKGASGAWYVYLGNATGLYKTEYFSRIALIDNTIVFTATSTLLNIQVAGANITIGDYGDVQPITVKEITGYRADQNYLAFDGTDDFLQTNNIDFTGTDKVSLFAGVRKLSDASRGVVLHTGAKMPIPGVIGNFSLEAPHFEFKGYSATIPGATGNFDAKNDTASAPHSAVLSAKFWQSAPNRGSTIQVKVNNMLAPVSGGNAMLPGNFGNLPAFIGRAGGAGLPFNGHIYSLIGIGKLTSDSETIAIEKELAKRVGVILNV